MPLQYYLSFEYRDHDGRLVFGPETAVDLPSSWIFEPIDPNNPSSSFQLVPDRQTAPTDGQITIVQKIPTWDPSPIKGWYILWWGDSPLARVPMYPRSDFLIPLKDSFYLNFGWCPLSRGSIIHPSSSPIISCGTISSVVGAVPLLPNTLEDQFYNIKVSYPSEPTYAYTRSYSKPLIPQK